MATSTIKSSLSINKNGGTSYRAGTISSNNYTAINSLAHVSRDLTNVGGVKETANLEVSKLNSNLTFAFIRERPIAKGVATTLNDAAANTIDADVRTTGNAAVALISSSHPVTSTRTSLSSTAIRDGFYNNFTGEYDAGYPDNQEDVFFIDGNVARDTSVISNRTEQGKLFFRGGKSVSSQSYSAKTG